MSLPPHSSILALDVGDARIGVARASVIAKLPEPLDVIVQHENVFKDIQDLITKEQASLLIIGLPRNLKGELTAQSRKIERFAEELAKVVDINIELVDESLSSVKADKYLAENNKQAGKLSQDSVAACYILEEFLQTNQGKV